MYTYGIKQGVRQIKRWMIAAAQDAHPGIKMLHANYAVGNLDMLIQQYPFETIKKVTGEDLQALFRRATELQDEAQNALLAICPEGRPTL